MATIKTSKSKRKISAPKKAGKTKVKIIFRDRETGNESGDLIKLYAWRNTNGGQAMGNWSAETVFTLSEVPQVGDICLFGALNNPALGYTTIGTGRIANKDNNSISPFDPSIKYTRATNYDI